MQRNIRCGSLFAALALTMLVVPATNAQQAPQIQQRQVQPAQPGQPLPGQPQPGQPRVIQQGRPAAGQQAQGHGTHVMAHWLLVDNQGEIELAKFAQEKAQNEEVKEFAKMMVQDHSDFIQHLQHVAGALNGQGGAGQPPGQPGQPPRPPAQRDQGQQGDQRQQQGQAQAPQQDERNRDQTGQAQDQNQQDRLQAGQAQPNRAQTGQPGQPQPGQLGQPGQPAQQGRPGQIAPRNAQPGAPAQAGGMGFDIVAIKHELGQQCLTSAKEALSEKEGAEFDTCYMDHQLFAHMQMLDTLKVFKRHAQGDLAELIQNGIATTEDHLMHAEKLVKQLHGGAAASTARRPGTQRD